MKRIGRAIETALGCAVGILFIPVFLIVIAEAAWTRCVRNPNRK